MEITKLRIGKKARAGLVIAFLIIYALITYISLRGQYLEYLELGNQYVEKFLTDIKCKYTIMGISFVVLSIIIYFINKGVKKGLKPFFEQENKTMPKLPNKSLTLVIAAIVSVIISNNLTEKILLLASNVSFGETDFIFNLDISYYMFVKPLIELGIDILIKLTIWLSLYMAGYYIVVFNFYFKAVDRELLKESKLIKKLLRNTIILAIEYSIKTIFGTQNIVTGKLLTLSNDTELIGAGVVESTIQLWGYIGLAILIVVATILAVKYFVKKQNKKIMYTVMSIPIYLVALFVVMVGYDFIFVKPNEFDKERKYIRKNIESTQKAYNIKVDETNVDYTGTVSEEEVQTNSDIIDNIPLVNEKLVVLLGYFCKLHSADF